ncbi:MAG: hypothetical protein Q9222_004728 [Ikaeria aurantiellina]
MSTAPDEADTGPELSISDTDKELEDDDHDEEQESGQKSPQKGAAAPLETQEETLSAFNSDIERDTDGQPRYSKKHGYQLNQDIAERPSSADGSFSIPDDTPSLQGSVTSSTSRQAHLSPYGRSPTPSLRPFDRRFQARIASSPSSSPRAASPAFLHSHSRQASVNSLFLPKADVDEQQTPWEVVQWTRLRKISGQAFSELGKRNFGRPICITISTSIALGTSKGIILIFDYNQNLKAIIGPGSKAVESGAVTSISISADHSTVAGGHASGHIFTWELAKPAKPFLHIPTVDRRRTPDADGHAADVAIVHLGFLGMRHTALVSADDKGMAFSHLATRGMGSVARTVKTTRVLGRYPEATPSLVRQRKPSSVLAFSPLPLGNADHASDAMGLVALLTPYLLVIVSTTPIAQTQYKTPRPKEVAAHSAMTAALAWFPSVKLKVSNQATLETSSRVKLVYCWSNVLTVLEVTEVEPSAASGVEGPPNLQFRSRSRWKSQEGIVAVQWLGRSVLAVLTITQQLVILEDSSLRETNSSDLIQKHIYHVDLFSQQLNMLVEQLDEEDASMHGVVADAFYMSFKAYKGRLFLLGFNEVSFGTLSNWADRLLALVQDGNHVGAIELATAYYTGEADKVSVGLPDDDASRHQMVQDKLLEMISASLRFTFTQHDKTKYGTPSLAQLRELASVCISACINIKDTDYLFDEVYTLFSECNAQDIFFDTLESFIVEDDVRTIPPIVIKDMVQHYTKNMLKARLEELLCHLDPTSMDLDQITGLCKRDHLFDALLYVWNEAMNDYTTVLDDLLRLTTRQIPLETDVNPLARAQDLSSAAKVFPYLSYILTSRIYPTGNHLDEDKATLAKADIYHYFFSGRSSGTPNGDYMVHPSKEPINRSFANLRRVLDFDASSFLSMLNEAFEDSFLNGAHDHIIKSTSTQLTETQKFGLSVNRQRIVSILLEVMAPPRYEPEDIVYLNMFIARNLPKFPQFIVLPGHMLHRVLAGLCEYPADDVAEDCQLSVEYLLSVYQSPDVQDLIRLLSKAAFFRVLRSVYRSEKDYPKLVQTCFDEGPANKETVFSCVADCLRATAELNEKQVNDVRNVMKANASQFVRRNVREAAVTVEKYIPDLHETMLQALGENFDDQQLEYLHTILDPSDHRTDGNRPSIQTPNRNFVELYVRLLCEHNPQHVNEYIEGLKAGDLRLEEVLPALETGGVIDAAIILMAREGKVREAMSRLTQHLHTLKAALLGLLDAAAESPDPVNTAEAVHDLAASIQKFTRIGIWFCQSQTKSVQHAKPNLRQAKRGKAKDDVMAVNELLWLDLIDAIVQVAKSVAETLPPLAQSDEHDDGIIGVKLEDNHLDTTRAVADLRAVVQEAFTALLSATSVPRGKDGHQGDVSFLRVLQAFLSRASASSPSLSNLRSVLSTIFSAYSYEERLLELANRLLDKDLFVHVAEADTLRRRGWRPLGQVCEGCGKRVWGPGSGGFIWDAWQRRNEEDSTKMQHEDNQPNVIPRNGKGKAIQEEATGSHDVARARNQKSGYHEDNEMDDEDDEESGQLIIFSCRHIFHRICLAQMREPGDPTESRRHGVAEGGEDIDDDPTHGFVNYVDQATAQSNGMLDTKDGAVTLRVDSTKIASGRGRDSLRLTSKANYNHGLVVLDLAHMPGNACGMWPAFWTTGPSWPSNGEIDIIEGVNLQPYNQMTMHTSGGCSLVGSSCKGNEGCAAKGGAFGDGFNHNKGGTYAMEWTSDAIKIWFFSKGQEPKDILGESPDPTKWSNPISQFQGGSNCDIDSHFKDQNIVFDTTFCGDWAGKDWPKDNVCSTKASSCEDYVKNNPHAFSEAYWTINALKVYSTDGLSSNDSSSSPPNPDAAKSSNAIPSSTQQPTSSVATSLSQQQPTSSVAILPSAQQPLQTVTTSAPVITSYIDGGPITVEVDPAPMMTQIVTGAPVTVTLEPGSPSPQEHLQKGSILIEAGGSVSWSENFSSSGRRRRGVRRRRHLAEHLPKIAGQYP